MQPAHDQPPSAESLRRGYESLTVNNRGLMIFLFFFLLTAAVLHTGIWVLAKYYATLTRNADVPRSAVPRVSPFVDPRLQPTEEHPYQPWQDLQHMREANRMVFEQLGWMRDAQRGTPHIPDDVVSQLAAGQRAGAGATRPATQEGGTR